MITGCPISYVNRTIAILHNGVFHWWEMWLLLKYEIAVRGYLRRLLARISPDHSIHNANFRAFRAARSFRLSLEIVDDYARWASNDDHILFDYMGALRALMPRPELAGLIGWLRKISSAERNGRFWRRA